MNHHAASVGSQAIGTSLVYEDAHVRIWTLDLLPGEQTPWHQHEVDYVYCVIAAGSTATQYADGTVGRTTERIGECHYHPAGQPHFLRNTGDSVYRNVIVELLATGDSHG